MVDILRRTLRFGVAAISALSGPSRNLMFYGVRARSRLLQEVSTLPLSRLLRGGEGYVCNSTHPDEPPDTHTRTRPGDPPDAYTTRTTTDDPPG